MIIGVIRGSGVTVMFGTPTEGNEGAAPAPILDMSTFFDVSLDILVIRELDGRVVKVSQSWETVLGYKPEEIVGGRVLPLIHPDDREGTLGSIVEVETRGPDDPVKGHINRYRHKDGHYRTLEWRAQRFDDRIYGVARDVTERVAAEQALIDARAAAEAANQAKSDFLANMSHEIRTPLNGVIGLTAALAQTELTAAQREIVELIERSGSNLERLVSDILDVSKVESGKLDIEIDPFDLGGELDGVVEMMRLKAEAKGLYFAIERGEDARGDFLGDTTRIKQVLVNLLSNAVKFTEEGGVSVTMDVADDDPVAGVATLTIAVKDTGVGFDATFEDSLFERFTQADGAITRKFGGSGLGLSICRSLIELMGGTIQTVSAVGQGSLFTVTIPLSRVQSLAAYDERAARSVTVVRADPIGTPCGLRVLLAEDHPVNQRVVQLILGGQGIEVVTVDNGAEALVAFQKDVFDLILMDMQMPVMDGLASTRAIRAVELAESRAARTPIVMLSANAMAQHRQDAAEAGADLHVAKPVTATSLLAGVAEGLEMANATSRAVAA